MGKISALPTDTAPVGSDLLPFLDVSAGRTEAVTFANAAASPAFRDVYVARSSSAALHEYARQSAKVMPTVMASPPTVTLGAGGAASGIASGVTTSIYNGTPGQSTVNTHNAFRLTGAPLMHRASPTNCVQPWNIDGVDGVSTVSGFHYGSNIEFNFIGVGGGTYRVFVDDVPVTAAFQAGPGGTANSHRLLIAHGSTAWRRMRVDISGGLAFTGVTVGPVDTFHRDDTPTKPTVLVIGDSFVIGTGATVETPGESWAWVMAQLMGFRNVALNGATGSGFTAAGSWGTHGTRLSNIATGYLTPDVVILQGSTNDTGASAGTITTAVNAAITTARSQWPDCYIVVLGLLWPIARTAAAATNHTEVIACTGADLVVDTASGPEGAWIVGTGKIGSTSGTGNADVFLNSDGIHPSTAGHQHFATRIADRLRTAWTSLPVH